MPAESPRSTIRSSRRRRKRLFVLLAICFGVGLAAIVGEVTLRAYVASRGWTSNCYVTGLVFFVPHQTAGYTLRPNLRLKSSTYDVTTNSAGLRGEEIAADKPTKVTRVLVLGGSSVFGYLVPDGEDSCVTLETLLDSDEQPSRYEVLNAGVPGYNIRQCRLRYTADLQSLAPDIVLLYLGWNDSKHIISGDPGSMELTPPAPGALQRAASYSVLYGLLRYRVFPNKQAKFAIPATEQAAPTAAGKTYFREELELLVEVIRDSGATPVLSTQLMAATSDAEGLSGYLGESAEAQKANRLTGTWLTEQIRTTAEELEVLLIDVAAEIKASEKHLGDAIHLTAAGHDAVAECWAKGLREMEGSIQY